MKAGIYFHIPFCKQACHYCNFHFSTSLQNKTELLAALTQEIDLRKTNWQTLEYQSIYFGGGTPSLLKYSELNDLLHKVRANFQIIDNAEITLEANPDDLNKNYLNQLIDAGVNRLSIGIQSFFDKDLDFMNRAHNASEALKVIEDAKIAGFNKISIDLIYGVPGMTDQQWVENLKIAASLPIDHISCYALTLEPNTAFHHFVNNNKMPAPNDESAERHFKLLQGFVDEKNWNHYEISNIAIGNSKAIHNSNYWNGSPYLGLGPAAHSYDGKGTRSWNISNNPNYIKRINKGLEFSEKESLTLKDQFNEMLMTGLRKKNGISFSQTNSLLANEKLKEDYFRNLKSLENKGYLENMQDNWSINKQHLFIADSIISELFWV